MTPTTQNICPVGTIEKGWINRVKRMQRCHETVAPLTAKTTLNKYTNNE